jgi:predicted metal-dependent phosphoesterase TrpH
VVGEEITTRSGHLLGLFLHEPVRPLLSLRESIRRIHAQGGLAIPAHPLVPIPLCVSARAIRSLLADPDPQVRPDAIEAFNPTSAGRPWRPRIHAFLDETGIAAVGNSDAHVATAIGTGWTTFPGRTAEDLRHAILTGTTRAHGTYYGRAETVRTFGRQLRKYSRDIRDEVRGTLRGRRTGRDLGYPGGHLRPARFEPPVEAVER